MCVTPDTDFILTHLNAVNQRGTDRFRRFSVITREKTGVYLQDVRPGVCS